MASRQPQQLAKINAFAAELVSEQQTRWKSLRTELADANIHIVESNELSQKDLEWLEQWFHEPSLRDPDAA